MNGERAMSMLVQHDQWARCAHRGTSLLRDGGVELDWTDEQQPGEECDRWRPAEPAGLAFDRWCHAYRARPAAGSVEVHDVRRQAPQPRCGGVMFRPRGLAVDRHQRLYVAEPGSRSVVVIDVWSRRVLRRVHLGPGRPVDLAVDCGRVLALVRDPDALVVLDGRRPWRPGPALRRPGCPEEAQPQRITRGSLVLWTHHHRSVVCAPDGSDPLEVEWASDIELTADGVLIVARAPGQSFRRFVRDDGAWLELEPTGAPGYDGGAIALTPDSRIAYTVASGYATTTGSVANHVTSGSVVSYRFDSGRYHMRWGRMLLDACLPPNTSVAARFLTTDVDEVLDPIDATRPARSAVVVRHPELTPPLPSRTLMQADTTARALFRRPSGRQLLSINPESYETYEAPVAAGPGRYLWVELLLTGTAQVTPRVRAIRIERPGHQLLNSLPRSWSRDEQDVDWLQRFLAPIDGVLHELDTSAAQRAILLDPRSTPAEALPWLASFAGLVLDRRWSESARRTLVAEAYQLYAGRGTKVALQRLVEIYLDRAPVIVERWQLRGLGGTVLGTRPEGLAAPVVGGSARATGTLGRFTVGGTLTGTDSYEQAAHRFTLLIPGELTDEQRAVVDGLIDMHRPAHTLYDVCELGHGMRVGQHLRLSLTAFVGPDSGWESLIVGQVSVGGAGVVGTPAVGSRLGESTIAGKVRVG